MQSYKHSFSRGRADSSTCTPPVGGATWNALSFMCCSLKSAHLHTGEKAHQEVDMHSPEEWVPTCHILYEQFPGWMHTSQGI